MITINLLAEKKAVKTTQRTRTPRIEGGGNTGQSVILGGILLVAVAITGLWWWSLNGTLTNWEDRHRQADEEIARLQEVLKKADKFEREKELLTRKIGLITDLKKKQDVPVQILDQVSRNVPSFLWLESMSASNNAINISGKAMNYNAVANFYENLNGAALFGDVTLGRTYEVSEGVAFSLRCVFANSITGESDETEEG